jgi:hypothetical protein
MGAALATDGRAEPAAAAATAANIESSRKRRRERCDMAEAPVGGMVTST